MLDNLVSKELIELNLDAKDWVDAVHLAAQPLIDYNKIKPSYVDAIIQNVQENGPYIVITPKVALPHARFEEGVIDTALGIATLKNPVEFGNEANDPVKYIFCLSAKGNEAHLKALADLAELLEDEKFYEVLDNAQSADEVMSYLNK